jgi:hypothetical protein
MTCSYITIVQPVVQQLNYSGSTEQTMNEYQLNDTQQRTFNLFAEPLKLTVMD